MIVVVVLETGADSMMVVVVVVAVVDVDVDVGDAGAAAVGLPQAIRKTPDPIEISKRAFRRVPTGNRT